MLALSSVEGYHGYVLFAWMYGLCLGGFLYSMKMLTMERVRGRHFTKVWGKFLQKKTSIKVLKTWNIKFYITFSRFRTKRRSDTCDSGCASYWIHQPASSKSRLLLFYCSYVSWCCDVILRGLFKKRSRSSAACADNIASGHLPVWDAAAKV